MVGFLVSDSWLAGLISCCLLSLVWSVYFFYQLPAVQSSSGFAVNRWLSVFSLRFSKWNSIVFDPESPSLMEVVTTDGHFAPKSSRKFVVQSRVPDSRTMLMTLAGRNIIYDLLETHRNAAGYSVMPHRFPLRTNISWDCRVTFGKTETKYETKHKWSLYVSQIEWITEQSDSRNFCRILFKFGTSHLLIRALQLYYYRPTWWT